MSFELSDSPDQGMALIKRQSDDDLLELRGPITEFELLADIPPPDTGKDGFQTLNLIPFRQVRERGFETHDEGTPLLSMSVEESIQHEVGTVLDQLPQALLNMSPIQYDLPDEEYEARIASVVRDQIGGGEGCNFVLPRHGQAQIENMSHEKALTIFRHLLESEVGAYWTFLFYAQGRYLIGATPERHISVDRGEVMMNPIAGTYRKNEAPAEDFQVLEHLRQFIRDPKEIHELFMTVDEELKQMARICSEGGMVLGPMLKPMSRLIHTEYLLKGHTKMSVAEVLKESMFAATVTGSPIESACRVIKKYEDQDRRYYASTLALIGSQGAEPYLDSPILIRTVEVDQEGQLEFRVGGTLVRDSDPRSERLETKVKSEGVLSGVSGQIQPLDFPDVELGALEGDLQARNADLSQFWIREQKENMTVEALRDKTITIIDAEDDFSHMLAHIIRHFGAEVTIVRYDEYEILKDTSDITILGPGPGDPTNVEDPKILRMNRLARKLMRRDKKLLGVCLGHQVMAHQIGFNIKKREDPQQGVPKDIDFFGETKRVGFYNTFTATQRFPGDDESLTDGFRLREIYKQGCELSADQDGSINAFKRDNAIGIQFHPESILSRDGVEVLKEILVELIS